MTGFVSITVVGDTAVRARFDSMGSAIHGRMLRVMTKLGVELHGLVIRNLSGQVLHRVTGRLSQAQNIKMVDTPDVISASVGFNRQTVPYGAIHEFGGTTRAHLIEAKNAKALRFSLYQTGSFEGQSFDYGYDVIFRKRVNHPGSKMPERSFLRSALAEIAPAAIQQIRDAALEDA